MNGNDKRSGQALLMVTISLSLILGMLALVADLGWGYYRREAVQTAADAAANAVIQAAMTLSPGSQTCGTNNVWCGTPAGTAANCPATAPTSPATTFDYGCALAGVNGFSTTGSQTVTIQANTTSPPPNVPGTTVTYWATVTIQENATTFFGAPTGGGPLSVAGVATSGMTPSVTSPVSSTCLYILSPTASQAFQMANGASVTTSSCGIYVNSNSSTAFSVTGGASVSATAIDVVGGTQISNATVSPTPVTGVSAIADPFAGVTEPTPAGTCQSGNFTAWQPSAYTPTAGTYCEFDLANGMSAILGPGTYIINGGGFSIQGGSTLTATGGVMFYLTGASTVNIANGSAVTLSAQTSGTYEGILFFQDRTISSPGSSTFAGGANMNLTGSLYFPNALLNMNNGSNTQTEALIVGTVNFQGGQTFKQATSGSQTGLVTTTPGAGIFIQ